MMGPDTSVAEQINPVDIHGGSDHGDYRGFHRGWVPWGWSPWSGGLTGDDWSSWLDVDC
jgi:hypothetical protein